MDLKLLKVLRTFIIFTLIILSLLLNGIIINDQKLIVSAQVIYVDINGNGNYTSIQKAIDNASAGDTIMVWSGNYSEDLSINKPILLIGNGTENTKIIGSGFGDVIYVTGNRVNISGFTILGSSLSWRYAGIKFDNVNNCTVKNTNCSSNYNGIFLLFSSDIYLSDNQCLNNKYGIFLEHSYGNNIIANNCTLNSDGVFLNNSNSNNVSGNILTVNQDSGIRVSNSIHNIITNNSLFECALLFTGSKIEYWSEHEVVNNKLNNKPLYYSNNQIGGTIPEEPGQIILANCSQIKIEGHSFTNSEFSITIAFSNNIVVRNNTFQSKLNKGNPIYLFNSNNNLVDSNNFKVYGKGIYLQRSDYNIISNNNCTYNTNGIVLDSSNRCNITNNICNYNNVGIRLIINSKWCRILNNTCNYNQITGIMVHDSHSHNIINNTCIYNTDCGISLTNSVQSCTLQDNFCMKNNYGLYIYEGKWNTIENNVLLNNTYGIYMMQSTSNNKVRENLIENNSKLGLILKDGCFYNMINHNNFITNFGHASDNTLDNYWYVNKEGNYWSNYSGEDNGINNRTAGDGVGDTNIPIYNDYYPFMHPNGWKLPGSPQLTVSKSVSNDGNFELYWQDTVRAIDYILEEDVTDEFKSPNRLFQGWVWNYMINKYVYMVNDKPTGDYYYRVRAVNEQFFGNWSTVRVVHVTILPSPPGNFSALVYPDGNALNLTWEISPGKIRQYIIESATTGMWQHLVNITHPLNTFDHTGLINNQKYYYQICAVDIYGQVSPYSKTIFAYPEDTHPPRIPTGLIAESLPNYNIRLTWTKNPEPDLKGYQIFMNTSESSLGNGWKLIGTVTGKNNTYIHSGAVEQVIYYFRINAFDEVPNYSNFSDIVEISPPDELHPSTPTGLEVINASQNSLTLKWNLNPDDDIVGYNMFRSGSFTGPYDKVNLQLITTTSYTDSGLNESQMYYYRVQAIDDANLTSLLSNPAYGMTLVGPRKPEVKNPISIVEILEDKQDDMEINLYTIFFDVNNDILTFRAENAKKISILIYQSNGTVVLTPDQNWNGNETITFYAFDGQFETSWNITIYVLGVNDPPDQPMILAPENGLEIEFGKKVDLIGNCTDPDIPYGDEITISWYSNIQGKLGEGDKLENVKLNSGQHLITLEVVDKLGEKDNKTIYISVIEKQHKTQIIEDPLIFYINLAAWIVIIVLLIILVLEVIKKKGIIGVKEVEPNKKSTVDQELIEE